MVNNAWKRNIESINYANDHSREMRNIKVGGYCTTHQAHRRGMPPWHRRAHPVCLVYVRMIEEYDGEIAIWRLLRFEEAIESRMIRGQSPRCI